MKEFFVNYIPQYVRFERKKCANGLYEPDMCSYLDDEDTLTRKARCHFHKKDLLKVDGEIYRCKDCVKKYGK